MKSALAIGVLVAVLAAGCGSTKTVTVTQTVTTVKTVTTTKTTTTSQSSAAPCSGADLKGSFDGVAGSAGAGQISYTLTLTNTSSAPCTVSGTPNATLLDNNGAALPTHIVAVQAGQGAVGPVVLQPGKAAKTDARFSPDVSGTGDAQTGPCEPTAHVLRVTAPGGGTVDAPISPPTAVCERGTLSFPAFTAAG
jgi:Domain of unknown function (DUF4232)